MVAVGLEVSYKILLGKWAVEGEERLLMMVLMNRGIMFVHNRASATSRWMIPLMNLETDEIVRHMLRRDMIKRDMDVLSLHIRERRPFLKIMGKSTKNRLEGMHNSMGVNLLTMVDNLHTGMTDAMSADIKANAICRDIVFYILLNAYM